MLGFAREDRREREREPTRKGNTIYVYGENLTEELLKKAFGNIGNVVNVNMEKDKK